MRNWTMIPDLRPWAGKPPPVSRWAPVPLVDRLAAGIDWPGNDVDCWLWMGYRLPPGYGILRVENRARRVHRLVYELYRGPIPVGLVLDHRCRVPACCNPWHLEAVTDRENILRGEGPSARAARQTHCTLGHELTPENIYRPPNNPNVRECRQCKRRRKFDFDHPKERLTNA